MESRSVSSEAYRFGFQGQVFPERSRWKKDPEWTGQQGSHLAFKYRIHDARIGRFLSFDPLTKAYPWNSPYAFSENRVIDAVELEGLEATVIIRDLTAKKEPEVRIINYRETRLKHGPLGNGALTIVKFKDKVSMHYNDWQNDGENSFRTSMDRKDFVDPPSQKELDEPLINYSAKIKFGVYAESGISFGGTSIKATGGIYQEMFVSGNNVDKKYFGDTKGDLSLGPFSLTSNVTKNEISFDADGKIVRQKLTYHGNTGKLERTDEIKNDLTISYGTVTGAEFNFKLNEGRKNVNNWHNFLNDNNQNDNNQLRDVPDGSIHK
jgi:hypothetical protein